MQHRANSKPTVRSNGPVSVLDAVLYVAPPPTDASQPSNTLVCAITTPVLLQSWGRIFNSERNNLGTLWLFSKTVDRISSQAVAFVCRGTFPVAFSLVDNMKCSYGKKG